MKEFVCKDRLKSPFIGIPICVKDQYLEKNKNFPYENRGGIIIEDSTFIDDFGNVVEFFKVRHKHAERYWFGFQLNEIGGIKLEFTSN